VPRKRLVRRVLLALLALVVVGVIVVSIGATTMVRRSLPDRDGTAALPGLGAQVTVLRDDRGVPQVYASTAADLFRAQGYVHAQDRFFEMDLRRHITAGRLSELVGPSEDALTTDKVVRTLGWRRVAEQELPLLAPSTRGYLQAYADGVNAYLAHRSPSQLGVEYALLGLTLPDYRIEPWTPVDSLAWLKAMAWDLKGNYEDEITRARLAASLPVKRINQLYPAYPFDEHAPIVSERDQQTQSSSAVPVAALRTTAASDALATAQRVLDGVPALVGEGDGVGSNSWVVSGSRSTTGMPLLANDPHLAPSVPGVWYQMGLHCRQVDDGCPFDVAGFTFSGLPGVVIGHNDRIAWGFTNLGPDVTDLYLERVLNDTVEVDGAYEPLSTRTETIAVRGGDPVTMTVRSTRHGPIISDVLGSARAAGRNAAVDGEPDSTRYDVSLAWTALHPGRTADAIFALDSARGWDDFRAAARLFEVPAQNLVYADVDGTIGYQAPGRIPVRRAGDGRWPVPGWQSRYDWAGYVPFADLPSVRNPAEGLIVAANQAVTQKTSPYLTQDWDYGFRSQRIRDLLEHQPKLSPDDMARIQLDTRNPMAPTLVPVLTSVDFSKDAFTREAQQLLRGWDFTQPPDSAAAAYYNAVWRNLLRLGFDDELGVDLAADGGDRWFEVVTTLLQRKDDPWWDNKATPGAVENRDEIVRQAMTAARIELTKSLGKDPMHWQWGRLHRLELTHPVLGGPTVPTPARWLVNRGPWDVGGGSALVNATGWDAHDGYAVNWVPSMRMVVDLGNLDRSRWVNLTGASGHPMDDHYTDQTDAWAQGRSFPWPFSEKAVREAAGDELVLRPGR
jgi:penicillin G amidase